MTSNESASQQVNAGSKEQSAIDPSLELFYKYTGTSRQGAALNQGLYLVDFEITTRCAGGCRYCYNTSVPQQSAFMSKEHIIKIVNELASLGVRQITWCGGDPLTHPSWEELVKYAAKQGLRSNLYGSAIISKRQAEKIVALPSIRMVGMHLDTIDQEIYKMHHREVRTMEYKMQSYRNLLESGYPREWVSPCICLTKYSAESMEQTLDWFIDEMGARYVPILIFKPEGLGREFRDWAPNHEQVWRAYSYRSKKLGDHWLRLGTSECGRFNCRTKFYITTDGEVLPCGSVPRSFSAGNAIRDSLVEVFQRSRDELLFNFIPKGKCGECENSDVCFGCRSNAYHFQGDIRESDSMCWKHC